MAKPSQCANRVNIPFSEITTCYNSNWGQQLQLTAERMTNAVQNPLRWVPTTTFNMIFNSDRSVRSETDLARVICEQIDGQASVCGQWVSITLKI